MQPAIPLPLKKSMKLTKQFDRYQSEITQFINELKVKNPALEESQRAGRALLWDKAPINLEQQELNRESVPESESRNASPPPRKRRERYRCVLPRSTW